MERKDFTVTVLPDDPKLSKKATLKRCSKSMSFARRQRFSPRSAFKNHQSHLVTDAGFVIEGTT